MVKLLKQAGPKIDPNGKNGKADKCGKMVILVQQGKPQTRQGRGEC